MYKKLKDFTSMQRRWRRGTQGHQSRATTLIVPTQEQDEEETSQKGTLGFLFKLAMRQDMCQNK